MALANEEEYFGFLVSVFPGYREWVYYESDKKISLEDTIDHHGKWVIYGSKEHVESLAEKVRPEIGNVIDAIKYSTQPTRVTPDAPYDSYALLVYCNDFDRDRVLLTLDTMGVGEEQATWKYDRQSMLDDLSDPLFCFKFAIMNYDRFKEVTGMLDVEIDPTLMTKIDRYKEFMDDIGNKFGQISEFIESGADEQAVEHKVDELFGARTSQKLKDIFESEQSETL